MTLSISSHSTQIKIVQCPAEGSVFFISRLLSLSNALMNGQAYPFPADTCVLRIPGKIYFYNTPFDLIHSNRS